MCEFIKQNFKGATVTITISGVPMAITGEVISTGSNDVVGIRLSNGNKVFINCQLIATVF